MGNFTLTRHFGEHSTRCITHEKCAPKVPPYGISLSPIKLILIQLLVFHSIISAPYGTAFTIRF